jgi:hypothetical protein
MSSLVELYVTLKLSSSNDYLQSSDVFFCEYGPFKKDGTFLGGGWWRVDKVS